MKPWNNPSFQTRCENCGRVGYNINACGGYGGVFICRDGCNPSEVQRYQAELFNDRILSLSERNLVMSDGLGI